MSERGERRVRGPTRSAADIDEPRRSIEAFTYDGFYRSGDLAMKLRVGDESGYVLADAALVAMPDSRLGERACAFVVVRDRLASLVAETSESVAEKLATIHQARPSTAPPSCARSPRRWSPNGSSRERFRLLERSEDFLPEQIGRQHRAARRARADFGASAYLGPRKKSPHVCENRLVRAVRSVWRSRDSCVSVALRGDQRAHTRRCANAIDERHRSEHGTR